MRLRQTGMILFGAIALLFVIGIAVTAMLKMSGNGSSDATAMEQSNQALFLAESAIERARSRFTGGTACTSLARDPPTAGTYHNTGSGSFAITAASVPAVSYCTVTGVGIVGNSTRTITSTMRLTGSSSNLVEHFPSAANYAANWTTIATNGKGTVAWNVDNCPTNVCATTIAGTGSVAFISDAAQNGITFSATIERPLAAPFTTGAGFTGTINTAMTKTVIKGTANTNNVYVYLVDSTQNIADLIFTDTRNKTPAGKWEYTQAAITFPATRTYDKVRISVTQIENATPTGDSAITKFDVFEILGTGGAGGSLLLIWGS